MFVRSFVSFSRATPALSHGVAELLRLEAVRAFVERSALVFDPKEAQQQNQRSKFEQG